MKTIWDYPVKYDYGYSEAYGSKFHTGEDRTVTDGRTDIPVTVNGVTIGIAGNTGQSTGIHTHIGKWGTGGHYPPKGGGAKLKDAVVTEVDTTGKTNNGKFVRVQSGAYSWVYLHLSSVKVKVGQKLEGGDVADANDVKAIYKYGPLKRTADASGVKHYTGKKTDFILKDHANSAEGKAKAKAQADKDALIKKLKADLKKKPKEVEKIVTEYVDKVVEIDKTSEVALDTNSKVTAIFDYFSDRWATFRNFLGRK